MIGALANNADIEKTNGNLHIIGDPTERALLVAAEKAGILDIRKSYTRLEEFPFDSDRKRMATVDETASVGRIVSMKGAPEVVLRRCVGLISPNGIKPMTDIDRKLILGPERTAWQIVLCGFWPRPGSQRLAAIRMM